MSDIQDFIEYIMKNHETLTNNPPIFINFHSINERSVLRIKHENKLELQAAETM